MTFSAPSVDFYDDGLVHSHDWSRNTPPGGKPTDRTRMAPAKQGAHDHDAGLVHDHRWARS